jgi:hypothetical protein
MQARLHLLSLVGMAFQAGLRTHVGGIRDGGRRNRFVSSLVKRALPQGGSQQNAEQSDEPDP